MDASSTNTTPSGEGNTVGNAAINIEYISTESSPSSDVSNGGLQTQSSAIPRLVNQTSGRNKVYIASLDVGTTVVRCLIFDDKARIIARADDKISLIFPSPGLVEIDPEDVWEKCRGVMSAAINKVGVDSILSVGVCTQRCSFLTWNCATGEALHNIITWKDLRADKDVKHWNTSALMKCVRWGSSMLYYISGNKRYQAASVLRFMNSQVSLRLKWVLTNVPAVQAALANKQLQFGTLDTWLVCKLTAGKVIATDFSNASATAVFDPYLQEWSAFAMQLVGLPSEIFPELRTSAGDWGFCDESLFGAPIPITAVVSDQGASLAGGGGHSAGHIKVTLGTGAFLNLNTGQKPHTSIKGIYPVVGWQDHTGKVVFMAEGSAFDVGTVVEWGIRAGLYKSPSETGPLAESVVNSGGVYFIPAFQGLQAPINDALASCGFIGITAGTTRAHLVRALLDSLVFLVYQLYETMLDEAEVEALEVRADGGVSSNRVVLQQISTLCNKIITRFTTTELSAVGTALIAGLGAGIYKSLEEVEDVLPVDCEFHPKQEERAALLQQYKMWQKATGRFTKWVKPSS